MVYLGTRELELKYKEIDMLIVSVCAFIDAQERWSNSDMVIIQEAEELIELLTFVRDADDDDESDRQKEERIYMDRIISIGNKGDGVEWDGQSPRGDVE
jgi:hypothetical protein